MRAHAPTRTSSALGPRTFALAGVVWLAWLPACADMLGFDDVTFAPVADASIDASIDASSPDAGNADRVEVPDQSMGPEGAPDDAPFAVCGDEHCDPEETCTDCPSDCGTCPVDCGNALCDPDETCTNCPADCGACPPSCGDGACNGAETCTDCPGDCGACPPSCGDGACNGAETCTDCPGDCGACPPACGDGACNGGESCSSCPADCKVTACPSPPGGFGVGSGLAPMDACAFPMSDSDTWAGRDAVIAGLAAALPVRTVTDVLADLNRQGVAVTSVPGLSSVHRAFRWEQGDEDVTYWIPQGLTGSGDAVAGAIAGKNVVVTSWYYDDVAPNKGVRLAFSDAASKAYRFALLVEPYMNGGRPDFKAVAIHAGGLAWWGNLLYVADTTHGFRVFDMSRILQVATGVDTIGYDAAAGLYRAHNYKYVVAQIGAYQHVSSCSPRFSFTALDRASSPPSIVSGEYIDADPTGRLYRWALDPSTGRLAGGALFVPSEAFYSGQTNIQGAVPAYGRWLLSSSAPAAGHGALYRVAVGSSSTHAWSDSPEDLYIDPSTGELWCLSEAVGARYVYSRLVSNYQ